MAADILLSEWVPWPERRLQPTCGGVYIVGKGNPAKVVYIGRTSGRGGLRTRLRTFNRSAATGRSGHAGGVTYHRLFGGELDDLYVRVHSAIAVDPDPKILKPYTLYVERRLIWEYIAQFGGLPACNSE